MMDIALLIPVIRQILQIAGGFLIARGWLDDGAADALIGIVVNAIVFGWWLIDRHRINKKNRELKQGKGETDHA
ncbi:O-antigen/teichoic acid export membrane protein [Ochrobactrum sp. P6BSIII]|uniref:Pam3-gp28 family putative phage holin n=1 Tax=unclassified Ochrobactrum TaxID=239106 RepID=UPI0017C21BAD|nr:O-antigen/teichoic acid export membrane protein [Ochrobactrum sp. P6BSIII]